jgi:hypothetical protein
MPGTRSTPKSPLQPSTLAVAGTSSTPSTVRLHVAPFSADLLTVYLSASSRAQVTDVSFHTVETFPENGFGFLTLPAMEAAAMKKKLHGSIVRGAKVKVQEARPDGALKRKSEADIEENEVLEEQELKKKRKKDKKDKDAEKAKEVDQPMEGYELPDDRKIKRGWTEPEVRRSKVKKGEKKQEKSKYSKEPEVLFKAKLPKNKLEPEEVPEVAEEPKTKDKKDKSKKDKSKKQAKDVVVVHEFARMTRTSAPSFLKKKEPETKAKTAHEYVDGKGWVDEDGNLIDETKPRKLLEEKLEEGGVTVIQKRKKDKKAKKQKMESLQSSVDITPEAVPTPARRMVSFEPEPTIDEDDEDDKEAAPKTPHPLETLFKKRKNTGGDESIEQPITKTVGFSFFGQEDNDEEADQMDKDPIGSGKKRAVKFGRPTSIEIPSTPYEPRQMRSGAPTPDTAAIGKRFSFSRGPIGREERLSEEPEDDEDESSKEDEDAMVVDGAEDEDAEEDGANGKDESTFSKWFWENRSENNRHWRQRRKEAMKEKKRRENKRIGRRVV